MASDYNPVRVKRGKIHAMPYDANGKTLCGRLLERATVDNGFPNCAVCRRVIKAQTKGEYDYLEIEE